MTGRIFPESANIYEDQAKVLFEYYSQRAEEIVKQEEALEKKIAVATEEKTQYIAEQQKKQLHQKTGYGVAGAVVVIAGIIAAVRGEAGLLLVAFFGLLPASYALHCMTQVKKLLGMIAETGTKISGFKQAQKDLRRDFRVHRLGLGYVPVAGRIPFEGKSFLIDYAGVESRKEFRLNTVARKEEFASSIAELEDLIQTVPVVEASKDFRELDTDQYSKSIQKVPCYDYLGGIDRNLRTVAECLANVETSSVDIPVIFPASSYTAFLEKHGTVDPSAGVVFLAFDQHQFDNELEKFRSLNQMKKSLERHSKQFEQVLRGLVVEIAQTVQAITKLKVTTTNRLVERSNRLFFTVLKNSYNHYSPKLEAEEIERIKNETFDYQESVDNYRPFQLKPSSRVLFDPISEMWVAEDGSKTAYPFGMQQLQEEIIVPIVQNLMQETRIERLSIYHNIQDQKNDYLNKWHQDTEDFYGRNRAESADLINLMRSSFTDFIANYNTLQALEGTERQMASEAAEGNESTGSGIVTAADNAAETVAGYELQRRQYQSVQEEFTAYIDRLKEEIDRRADKFRYIEYYDASLRDNPAKAMSTASSRTQSLDDRRKPLLAVNPLFAEASELAPLPALEDLVDVHSNLDLNAVALDSLRQLDSMGRS